MQCGGESVTERRGTRFVGTPVEPRAHPANQHAAAWVASEAPPANHYTNYMNSSAANNSSLQAYPLHNGGNNPYVHAAPVPSPAPPDGRSSDKIWDALNQCGKKLEVATRKAETFADGVWQHFRTGPSVTDAAMARLAQGTKVLVEGGHDKVFQKTFQILPGEKFLKARACYLSTSTGPVIGTLYISNKRLAFCSDHPLCYHSPSGQLQWMYYKVVLMLDQLSMVNPSSNGLNPTEKYIHIVTRDGYAFWFMGFMSYDKALKNINEALHHYRNR